MFTRIPTVLRSQEIIDKAFSKASKVEEPYQPRMEVRIRKEIQDRISSIEGSTVFYLRKMVKKFPSNDALHPFYRNLLDMMFDLDQGQDAKVLVTREKYPYGKDIFAALASNAKLSPLASVEPIYIPGTFRTAFSPSSI